MALITVTHVDSGEQLRFNPGRSGKVVHEEVSKLWGQGLVLSAADIVITEEDLDLSAGDYTFRPGAYLICPHAWVLHGTADGPMNFSVGTCDQPPLTSPHQIGHPSCMPHAPPFCTDAAH